MNYESPAVRDARIDVAAVLDAVGKRLPRIILLTLALLAATFALLLFVPRLYESSASILVESRSNIYSRAANEQAPSASSADASTVSSQIELIKSRDTLLKVIDQLDLRSVSEFNGAGSGGFSPLGLVSRLLGRSSTPVSVDETVLNNLYARLTVVQERDSNLISVLVRSTDPQRAADIANAVANAHVARRAQLSLSDTAEASGWLRDEIDRLRVVVKDAETAVANFKVDNDLFTGSNNTSLLDQQLSAVSTQISSAQERKNTALSRAEMIRGMLDRGQSIEGVADVRDSTVIQRLSEDKARLQGEMAQRSATLLASHPTIRALKAQISELDNQIAIEGRRVASALEAEAQIEAGLEKSLKAELSTTKVSASTATQDTVTLDGLQREAKAQRDLLEGYLQRYNEAFSRTETSSALPDVRVVSIAAPSVSPASPKTQLILIAVGIVALAIQIGLIVFTELMSGRAIIAGGPIERPQDELEEVPFSVAELEPDQQFVSEAHADAEFADQDDLFEETSELEAPGHADEPYFADSIEPAFDEPVLSEGEVDVQPEPEQDRLRSAIIRSLASYGEPDAVPQSSSYVAPSDAHERVAQVDEHVLPVAVASPEPSVQAIPGVISMSALASDLVMGRTHLLMLAAHRANAECEALAEELVADALARGLSVALVDAGSARTSDEPGLSDLSCNAASFGDVVHKSADNSFAEVPWGRVRSIARQSSKPVTLVEALGDIYEVVVLLTGRVGMNSALPMFAGMTGRVVLVADVEDDTAGVAASRAQLIEAGFSTVEIAQGPARVAA
ncbi:MAG: GumC family protein [Devosia sp.]